MACSPAAKQVEAGEWILLLGFSHYLSVLGLVEPPRALPKLPRFRAIATPGWRALSADASSSRQSNPPSRCHETAACHPPYSSCLQDVSARRHRGGTDQDATQTRVSHGGWSPSSPEEEEEALHRSSQGHRSPGELRWFSVGKDLCHRCYALCVGSKRASRCIRCGAAKSTFRASTSGQETSREKLGPVSWRHFGQVWREFMR